MRLDHRCADLFMLQEFLNCASGREAITSTPQGFMTAVPDMVVKMNGLKRVENGFVFGWTWTGTNTGPGGTGKRVHISGYEEWTIGRDGLIKQSLGHFYEAEYERQVKFGSEKSE